MKMRRLSKSLRRGLSARADTVPASLTEQRIIYVCARSSESRSPTLTLKDTVIAGFIINQRRTENAVNYSYI